MCAAAILRSPAGRRCAKAQARTGAICTPLARSRIPLPSAQCASCSRYLPPVSGRTRMTIAICQDYRAFAPIRAAAYLRVLFLPECPLKLVVQRLDQVRDHRAIAGLNEGLDRHAGRQLHLPEFRDLLGRHRDANEIIALSGALVGRGVGTDPNDRAVDLGGCSHVKGGEAKNDWLSVLDLIDILRLDL